MPKWTHVPLWSRGSFRSHKIQNVQVERKDFFMFDERLDGSVLVAGLTMTKHTPAETFLYLLMTNIPNTKFDSKSPLGM